MPLDESPHGLAEAGEQGRLQEEAAAARDRRAQSEDQGIEAGDAAGNGDHLIGDGGEAAGHHDQYAPAPVNAPELFVQGLQPIEIDDGLADGPEQEMSDGIAQQPTQDGAARRHGGDAPGLARARQHHGDDENVRGEGEDRALRDGEDAQPEQGPG